MTLKQKKQKIKSWTDFYGGDIIDPQMVDEAKNDQDLSKALSRHVSFLEDTLADALTDISDFEKSLKLEY